MKKLLVITLLLPFALRAAADRAIEELDIREATFRYQFGQNASVLRAVEVICLRIVQDGKETDPDDAFMKCFEGNIPPVTKVSECYQSRFGVTDSATGKRGLTFRTEAIKWTSETEVQVEGGFYGGGRAASGNTYYLRKTGGKWTVLRDILHWEA